MRGKLPLLADHTSMLHSHRSWPQLITVLMIISKSSRSAPPLLNGVREALALHPRKKLPHASSLHRARSALQRAPQNRPGHHKQPGIAAPPPLPQSPLHPRLPRRVHCCSEKVQKHAAAVISQESERHPGKCAAEVKSLRRQYCPWQRRVPHAQTAPRRTDCR